MKLRNVLIPVIASLAVVAGAFALDIGKVQTKFGFTAPQAQPYYVVSTTTNQAGSILPQSTNSYDLGSWSKRWRNVFVNGTIYATSAQLGTLSVGGVSVTTSVPTLNQVLLKGATSTHGIGLSYIKASKLDIAAVTSTRVSGAKAWFTNFYGNVSSTLATVTTFFFGHAEGTSVSSTRATANTLWFTKASGPYVSSTGLDSSSYIKENGKLLCKADGTNCPAGLSTPSWAQVTVVGATTSQPLFASSSLMVDGKVTMGSASATKISVSSTIWENGKLLCKADGTNCPAGVGTPTLAQVTLQGATTSAYIYSSSSGMFDGKVTAGGVSSTNITASGLFYGQSLYQTVTKEPTGFPSRTDSTVTFSTSTRQLTITPTGATFDVWSKGTRWQFGATSSGAIANATGTYIFYFNPAGVLLSSTSFPSFTDGTAIAATVYFTPGANAQKYIGFERHGVIMDGATHKQQHFNFGMRYQGTGLTGVFTNTTFSLTEGTVSDEDLDFTVPATTTNAVFYKSGGTGFSFLMNQTIPYKMGTLQPQYNNGNALADVGNTNYWAVWTFATNNVNQQILTVIGQRQDTSIANARANNTPDALSMGNLPTAEMKLLYRSIYRNGAGTPSYIETADYRNTQANANTNFVATNHAALTNLDFATAGHSGNLSTVSTITPVAAATYSLGSYAFPWLNLYASGTVIATTGLTTYGAMNAVTIGANSSTQAAAMFTGRADATKNMVAFSASTSAYIFRIDRYGTATFSPLNSKSAIVTAGNIVPSANNTQNVGNLGTIFANMYAANFIGTQVTTTNLGLGATGNITVGGSKAADLTILTSEGGIKTATSGYTGKYLVEMTTNKANFNLLAFSSTTPQRVEWDPIAVNNYDGGTVTATYYYTATSTCTGNAVFAIKGVALNSGDTLDTAFGTAVSSTVALDGTANHMATSSASAAITLGGNPRPGSALKFRVLRDPANAADVAGCLVDLYRVVIRNTKNRYSQ
jgi:hypothetical protein